MIKNNLDKEVFVPTILSFVHEKRMQAFVTWLIEMADSRYASAAPDLHALGQNLIRNAIGCDSTNIRIVGRSYLYTNAITVSIGGNNVLLAFLEEINDVKSFRYLMDYINSTNKEWHKKVLFSSVVLPKESEGKLNANNYNRVNAADLLSELNDYTGNNEIVIAYRNVLKAVNHDDFMSIPIGHWTVGMFVNLLNKLRTDLPELKYPVWPITGEWYCTIQNVNLDSNIIVRAIIPSDYNYSNIKIEVESRDEILSCEHQMAFLRAIMSCKVKYDISAQFIQIPQKTNKAVYKKRLATIKSGWFYNIGHYSINSFIIDYDVVLSRYCILSEIVKALSQVPRSEKQNQLSDNILNTNLTFDF